MNVMPKLSYSAKEVAHGLRELGKAGIAGGKAGRELKELFEFNEFKRPKWLTAAFEALCDDAAHVERCFAGLGWYVSIPCDLGSITSYVKNHRDTDLTSLELDDLVTKLQENLNGTST